VIGASDFLKARSIAVLPTSQPLQGRVVLPGSKSITNRALLLAALAKGTSRLSGALKSDDTHYMAEALRQLGVRIDEPDPTSFVVRSHGLRPSPEPLFVGNAGTAARFLTAAAATIDGTTVIDGDANMRVRPIGPLVDALGQLGVDVLAPSRCPPVTVRSHGILGGRVMVDAALSSQYVSALLMAAACANRATEIVLNGNEIGARGYIELTLATMRTFGSSVMRTSDNSWLVEPTGYRSADIVIEPDASAATYIWAAGALTGGSIDLGLSPDRFTQPDAAAYALIASFPTMPGLIDGAQIQDAVPTLAILAALNKTPVRFVGISNLRVKECDRIAALAAELCRMRSDLASVEGDDLLISGDPSLDVGPSHVVIESYDDHRIAMAFGLMGLRVGNMSVRNPGCVAKTYPGFWNMLASVGAKIRLDS
jgi:3-phosphoshikimate 1-carboxyvinyltransferase